MDCNSCKEKQKEAKPVPHSAYELAVGRLCKINFHLYIVIIILIVALVLSNGAWIYYESQFETVETKEVTQDVDTGNGDAIVTGIGDVYGASEADSQNNETPSP